MDVLSNNGTVGWLSGPNTRGTMDIIWSSLLTVFLCTWTAICLNLPGPKDSQFQIFCRRAKWMFWAIVSPELVLSVAIGQHASARRSVKRFRKLGLNEDRWTLRHGFYADMGGMLLQPRDSTPFLVNSRQLAYLVEKKYLECPQITQSEIWDKSKTDTLARLLSLGQATWLMIQLFGRFILKLPTTTLELSAGAIVICTFGTFVCWMHKPSDVHTGIVLSMEVSTAEILLDAGDVAASPYRHTPLDFIAKQSFTCGYDVMGFFGLRLDDRERPLRRFPNDRFPDIGTLEKFSLFCLTTAFASFHLIGWYFIFPSRVERLLWRISSSIVTAATVLYWIFETIAARQRFGRWDKYLVWLRLKRPTPQQKVDAMATLARQDTVSRLDAFEKEQREAKPILGWEIGIIVPVIFLYASARGYMIVEVFVSLRQLPIGAFTTFEVADMLPHW
ncbi:hypothetical protein N7522_005352 [Penicillium canescens]|uniref:Uncharacterized protein n=1 Tax=Penicillium canescens TaxID=5083 RepID=A0AAD6NBC2_PENCN|nr:uncharacterized protein N7446_011138 [Penicillium canescens]KAJ6007001.1 hypothetical protein N7522_005352 [Penicillium canescens]KAJ6047945.1 hypothetical protein N7460_004092 [Penicillium canescens]KAJ6048455.1 hypothetical protein N7446_011138 [Penicillium canescens]